MVLKLVGFCCSVESGWLIGDGADVGVVQGWGRIFAEVSVEEVEELRSDSVLSVVVSYFPCVIPSSIIDSSFPM